MASPHNIRYDLMNHALAREPAVQRQAQQAIIAPSPRSGTRRFMRGQRVLPPANNPSDLTTSVGSPDNETLLIKVNTQSQSGNSPNNFVANDVDDTFVPMPRMGNASDSDDFEDLEETIELAARNHPLNLDEDDINPQGECECDLDSDGKIVHNSNCHLMKEMQQLLDWNVAEEVEVNTDPHLPSDVSYYNNLKF